MSCTRFTSTDSWLCRPIGFHRACSRHPASPCNSRFHQKARSRMTPCADKTEAGRKSLQKRHGSLNSNLFLSILLQTCLRNHFATTTACPRNFWMQLQDLFLKHSFLAFGIVGASWRAVMVGSWFMSWVISGKF